MRRSFVVSGLVAHHFVEIISCDVATVVDVHFLEYFVHLLVSHVLSQLRSHHLELLGINFSLNKAIITLLSVSNDLNTSFISSWLWVQPSFPVASFKKAWKVSPPTFSVSRSLRMLQTNLFVAANPRLTNAFFSSTGSTTPLESLSKISKAHLTSLTSSIETDSDTQSQAAHSFLTCLDSWPFLAGG